MTHTGPIKESSGTLSEPSKAWFICRKCKRRTAKRRNWESSCGGYEDSKYTCLDKSCSYTWWIDGIDS